MNDRFAVFSIVSMLVVGSVTAVFAILTSPHTDPVDAKIALFDQGQKMYLEEGRSAKDRSGMLWVAEELAEVLSKGQATNEQAAAIESRLDWVLKTTGKFGMSEKDFGRYERIEIVVRTRQAQQVQIEEIKNKRKCQEASAYRTVEASSEGVVIGLAQAPCR